MLHRRMHPWSISCITTLQQLVTTNCCNALNWKYAFRLSTEIWPDKSYPFNLHYLKLLQVLLCFVHFASFIKYAVYSTRQATWHSCKTHRVIYFIASNDKPGHLKCHLVSQTNQLQNFTQDEATITTNMLWCSYAVTEILTAEHSSTKLHINNITWNLSHMQIMINLHFKPNYPQFPTNAAHAMHHLMIIDLYLTMVFHCIHL